MTGVCSKCGRPLEAGLQCSQCHGRFLDSAIPPGDRVYPQQAEKWHQTPWGKIVAGLLLVLGLCYGLSQVWLAIIQTLVPDPSGGFLPPLTGLAMFAGFQALVLVMAGALVGAGQRRGFTYGALVGLLSGGIMVVGLLNGTLAVLLQPFVSTPLVVGTPIWVAVVYGLPPTHILFGCLGTLAGGMVWKPQQVLSLPAAAANPSALRQGQSRLNLPASSPNEPLFPWAGPVDWLRILGGILVAVCGGIIGTRSVVDFLIAATEGYLKIENRLQDRVTLMEVFALSIFLGGCIAGATTPNGLKQGFWVGLGAATLIFTIFVMSAMPPFGSLLSLGFSALVLAPLGGWFGTELLPPALGLSRRRKKASWF